MRPLPRYIALGWIFALATIATPANAQTPTTAPKARVRLPHLIKNPSDIATPIPTPAQPESTPQPTPEPVTATQPPTDGGSVVTLDPDVATPLPAEGETIPPTCPQPEPLPAIDSLVAITDAVTQLPDPEPPQPSVPDPEIVAPVPMPAEMRPKPKPPQSPSQAPGKSWKSMSLDELSAAYTRNATVKKSMREIEAGTRVLRTSTRAVVNSLTITSRGRRITLHSPKPTSRSLLRCYMYLQIALNKGGMIDTDRLVATTGPNAKAAGPALKAQGFVNLLDDASFKSQIIDSQGKLHLPTGAVLVYGGTGAGHIEMKTTNGYVSDYISDSNRTLGHVTSRDGGRKLIGVYIKPSLIGK